MLKKSLIIATAMFAAVVGLQPTQQAEAKVKLNVHIGVPGGYYGGYYGKPRHGHFYGRPRHGGYYGRPRHGGYYGGWRARRISCVRGKRIVRSYGYRFIVPIKCGGRVYKYKASRGGNRFILKMKSRNGRIFSRRAI